MKTVAVIQARMGSTRLAGKVLRLLRGQPVLWHVIERLRRCEELDELVLATTTSEKDEPLVEYGRSLGLTVVRGPEDDVLQRFALAASSTDAEVIVRVTGDAPLVDPEVVDLCVRQLRESGADFVVGDGAFPVLHEGTDVFSRRGLDKLLAEAADDPVAREHVPAYFILHPDFVPTATVALPRGLCFEGARISVDTPDDLRFMEAIHEELGATAGQLDLRELVKLLQRKPALLTINQHVRQKDAEQRTRHVLVRCDGDGEIGLGHVYRCLAIAEALRDLFGCAVRFAVRSGPAAVSLIEEQGFTVRASPREQDEASWLGRLLDEEDPLALLVDVRRGLDEAALRSLRRAGLMIGVLDDGSDRRLAADLVFYPPVPQAADLEWPRFEGVVEAGWEWVPLRKQFRQHHWSGLDGSATVLICLGGGDPSRNMAPIIETMGGCHEPFSLRLLLGKVFTLDEPVQRAIESCGRQVEVFRDVTDVAPLLARTTLAVLSFSGVAYEAAAVGLPAIHLALTEDHQRSSLLFVKEGLARSPGMLSPLPREALRAEIDDLLSHPGELSEISRLASSRLDGGGATRIAERLLSGVKREAKESKR